MASVSCHHGSKDPHRADLVDLITGKRSIRSHQEMAPGSWYQRSDYPNEVVVHVARISKRLSACGHDGRNLVAVGWVDRCEGQIISHQLVGLVKRWRLDVQPVSGDACQSAVVQHNDRVRVIC